MKTSHGTLGLEVYENRQVLEKMVSAEGTLTQPPINRFSDFRASQVGSLRHFQAHLLPICYQLCFTYA